MAEGDKPNEQMERRIKDAYGQLPEIQSARKRLRIMGWVQIILPVIILAVGIWSLYSTAKVNLVDRRDELVTNIQERWGSVMPRLEREAGEAAQRVMPAIEEELAKAQEKVATTLPAVMERESRNLNAKLESATKKRIKEALDKVAKKQRQRMEEVFGDHIKCKSTDTTDICNQKNEAFNALMLEIQAAYEEWAIHEMTTTFARHLTAIEEIRTTMTRFTAAGKGGAANASAGSGAAPGDMVMLFLELVTETMGGTGDILEGGSPAPEPKADDPNADDTKPAKDAK